MKRVRITKSQLLECLKTLDEAGEINIEYQKQGTAMPSMSDVQKQYKEAQKKVTPGTEINMTLNKQDLNIAECISKKDLKESVMQNLKRKTIRENCMIFKKKDLK